MAAINAGMCHQQRGRFGLAVGRYEQALAGRFNQEELRRQLLDDLEKARRDEFLADPPPDPGAAPAGRRRRGTARPGGRRGHGARAGQER